MSDMTKCPESGGKVAWGLLCVAVLSSLLLIANPGFFSHDELQKIDHVSRFGFLDYLNTYVVLYQGLEFGQPVRPFSFLFQGIVSYFFEDYPVAIHLLDVLTHWCVALLLFAAIVQFCGRRHLAWIASIVFLCSPLSSFSVGWAAALMDRFYVLFGLAAFMAAVAFVRGEGGVPLLLRVVLFSTLAMMSKETAAVWPATLCLLLVLPQPRPIDAGRWWAAAMAWSVPIVLFMAYRMSALANSFGATQPSPYAASFANLFEGVWIYAAYPFLPRLAEAGSWPAMSAAAMNWSLAAHLLLVGVLWRLFAARFALLYLAGYFVFLLPVLLISWKGAHYLYGSGIALSVACAAVIVLPVRPASRWVLASMALLLGLGAVHAYRNQMFIYGIGSCMDSAATSLESAYLSGGRPRVMRIAADAGAPLHILYRLTTGREQVGGYFPVHVEVVDAASALAEDAGYAFNKECLVYKRVPR